MEWVTTDNVKRETWRRLLEYANDDFAINAIEKKFGSRTSKDRKNQKKQAKQIRLCLLQAKEYLDSAEHSSIFTSPNLLYYATVSLCTATMLINGSGEKSIDYLRSEGRNRKHGLSLQLCNASTASISTNLLEFATLTIEREGFFKEWHETLPIRENVYFQSKIFESETVFTEGINVVGQRENQPFSDLVGEKVSLLELLKRIPDQVDDLKRLGIMVNASRADESVKSTVQKEYRRWVIHHAGSPQALDAILSAFKIEPADLSEHINITKNKSNTGAIVNISIESNAGARLTWPEARWTTNGTPYIFSSSFGASEIVDCLGILYILGMICRYYPDIWIDTIDKHSISSKIIENTIETLKRKIPILALELMSKDKVVISSRMPPWHA